MARELSPGMSVARSGRVILASALLAGVAACAGVSSTAASPPRTAADSSGRRAVDLERRLVEGARPTPSGVRLRVTAFETYIPANTRQEFLDRMRNRQTAIAGFQRGAQRPNSSQWRLGWTWEQRIEGNLCGFRTFTVNVDYQAHFARIAGPIAEDPVIQEWWTGQSERIVTSRLGELRQLRDAASEIQKKMRPMFSANCEQLAREANSTAQRMVQELADRMNTQLISDPPSSALGRLHLVPDPVKRL